MKYITLTVALVLSIAFGAKSQDVTKKITDYMTAFNTQAGFSGNVVVVKDGKVIFDKSYGKASIELGVANNNGFTFRTGTLTQQFVAYAALKMYGAGKLSLENPISFYLPEYRKDVGQKVKIIDLLMQTSGLPDFLANPNYLGDKSCFPMSKAEFIKKFCSGDPTFEPSTSSAVSSTNYYLLGIILERQTGKTLDEVLQDYVFGPLAMGTAGVESAQSIAKGLVSGYTKDDNGTILPAGYINLDLVGGAGAVYLSIGDLQRWGTENMKASEDMKKIQSLSGSRKSTSAFGWTNDQKFGRKHKGASGIMKGFKSSIDLYTDNAVEIYILSNYEFASVDRLRSDLAAITFGEPYSVPGQAPTAIKLSVEQLKAFEGDYIIDGNPMQIIIKIKGDQLFVGQNLEEMDEMLPIGKDEFFMKSKPDSRLKFERTGNTVSAFTLYLSDSVIRFKRK